MIDPVARLAVCIPTFRRVDLLSRLLDDLGRQAEPIDRIIVVDGDPSSGEVPALISRHPSAFGSEVVYVPSPHPNLPFQRFLGWKAAVGFHYLLYLDDDMQLSADSVKTLVAPLRDRRGGVVGVTAEFAGQSGARGDASSSQRRGAGATPPLIRFLGGSRRVEEGQLAPSGQRRPIGRRSSPYWPVGCLRGGAMAYRMTALRADCFLDTLFALYQRGWGRGEDVVLSRLVGSRGKLLTALRSGIVHSDDNPSEALRRSASTQGHAIAYSRRLLNDRYRGFDKTRWADRLALARSYAGHLLLHWMAAVRTPTQKTTIRFAWGYSRGVLRGLLRPPAAASLTPRINWRRDADSALGLARVLARKVPLAG